MLDTSHPITFANFRGFVAAQPAGRRYEYTERRRCAVGCWLKSIGRADLIDTDWGDHPVLGRLDDYACYYPQSYGALAKRLRRRYKSVF